VGLSVHCCLGGCPLAGPEGAVVVVPVDNFPLLPTETAANSSGYSCSNPNSSVTSTYGYNGDGLRVSDAPAGGSAQQFTWDSGSVPTLLEDGTNFYLYGPNIGLAPIEQITVSGSTPSYLASDTTGVREQLSSLGAVNGSTSYDSFGNPCSTCSIATPFRFTGGYTDATGNIYLIHRYYDSTTGQFISVDPDLAATAQPYAYTGGDPVNATDPEGLRLPIAVTCSGATCVSETQSGLGDAGVSQTAYQPSQSATGPGSSGATSSAPGTNSGSNTGGGIQFPDASPIVFSDVEVPPVPGKLACAILITCSSWGYMPNEPRQRVPADGESSMPVEHQPPGGSEPKVEARPLKPDEVDFEPVAPPDWWWIFFDG